MPDIRDLVAGAVPQRLGDLCRPTEPLRVVAAIQEAGFSNSAYLTAHPDLRSVPLIRDNPWRHFLVHGVGERRQFAIDLKPEALENLRALSIENRAYVTHILAALSHAYVRQDHFDELIQVRWPAVVRLRQLGAMPFLLIGSSDARNYSLSSVRAERWLLPLQLIGEARAAMGLANLRGSREFGDRVKRFVRAAAALPGGDSIPCLLKFGQVDTEFAYHLSRVREGKLRYESAGFHAFCERSVRRYATFLSDLVPVADRQRVTIASVFPSSLSDAAWADGFLVPQAKHLRDTLGDSELERRLSQLEIPNQWERTRMTRYYNNLLQNQVEATGFRFLNDFDALTNSHGLIDDIYTAIGKGRSCHIDVPATRRELSLFLWQLVDAQPNPDARRSGQ